MSIVITISYVTKGYECINPACETYTELTSKPSGECSSELGWIDFGTFMRHCEKRKKYSKYYLPHLSDDTAYEWFDFPNTFVCCDGYTCTLDVTNVVITKIQYGD